MAIDYTNTFAPNTTIKSAETNTNNTDLRDAIRAAHHQDADGTQIVNADVSNSAAIAYSKLNLTGSITNADVNSSISGKVIYMPAGGFISSINSSSASYGNENQVSLGSFYFNATANNISTIKFYFQIHNNSAGSDTVYARTYDDTGSSAIAGTEVTTTSSSDTNWEITGDVYANLTAGVRRYHTQCKSQGTDQVVIHNCLIEVTYK